MTDFSHFTITESTYLPLCRTRDHSAIYAMNATNNRIYRTYDGNEWEDTGITIRGDQEPQTYHAIYPYYASETEDDEVVIVDYGAGVSGSIIYWISAKNITTAHIGQALGRNICATKDCVYGTAVSSGTWTVRKYGRDGSIQNLHSASTSDTSPLLNMTASSKHAVIANINNRMTYVYDNDGALIATVGDIGDIKICFENKEQTIVIADQYINSSYFYLKIYEFKNNEFHELHRIEHSMYTGRGRSQPVDSTYIENELHNKLYLKLEDYAASGQLSNYRIYGLDLDTLELEGPIYNGVDIGLPFDIGAGQVMAIIRHVYEANVYYVYYTEEGKKNWIKPDIYYEGFITDFMILENGNLLGQTGSFFYDGKKPKGLLCKFNVKNSGVKIFIDGEKKDLRAYNLTNPDVIRQNKIHVINATGEHVILYDRRIPEPRKKHLAYFDGKEVRYIYSV